MATKGAIPPKLYEISGLIPLTQTLFIWPTFWTAVILIIVSVLIAYFSAPKPERAKTVEDFGLKFEPIDMKIEPRQKPGEWLEYSPVLIILVGAILIWYLVDVFQKSPMGPLAALDLNTYNLIFITVGMFLHWRPKRFLHAVAQSVPATGGVLIQFPFYAVIFGMIVGTGITHWLAKLFVEISTPSTYPLLVALYSAVLGRLHPLRRQQVGHRGALRAAGGHSAGSQPRLGCPDLQRGRGHTQPAQPLLDAAAAGPSPHEGEGPRRLLRPADDHPHPACFLPVLVLRDDHSIRSAREVRQVI